MKIALCQINTKNADLRYNTNKILDFYNKASGVDLAVFPELCITGYGAGDIFTREDFINEAVKYLEEVITPKIGKTAILVGSVSMNKKDGKKLLNSAYLIHEGKILDKIDKYFLPSYKLFEERRFFNSSENSKVINFRGSKLGVTICADMWLNLTYPKDPIAELGNKGVDFFINLSASPFSVFKNNSRIELITSISKKWGKPFIAVNMVGGNDGVIFDGKSKVCNSNGEIVIEGKGFEEDLIIVDTDNLTKKTFKNFSDFENIYSALSLGLKDYLLKNNLKKVVIGLSGGIDSAICTAIAADAIGKDNVTCITMPTRFSSLSSVSDSEKLCDNLGVKLINISIESIFSSFEKIFSDFDPNSLTIENIQPRIRANILMAMSSMIDKSIVITPGNKSEIAMGYSTLYGDSAGAIALIGDLYKTEVYKLANFINESKEKEIIPLNIINKKPSAELRPNQYDDDDLPAYEILDKILFSYIDEDKNPSDIIKNLNIDKELVNRIILKVNSFEFKRKQMPPIIRVSEKCFGLDRRWPLTSGVPKSTI